MSLTIYTSQPQKLLDNIKKAIAEKKIDTWECDKDGDFTHVPEQWKGKGWLRPKIVAGTLQLGLLGQQGIVMNRVIYGVYHGRFSEMLFTHFHGDFSTTVATSQPQSGIDQVQLS